MHFQHTLHALILLQRQQIQCLLPMLSLSQVVTSVKSVILKEFYYKITVRLASFLKPYNIWMQHSLKKLEIALNQ